MCQSSRELAGVVRGPASCATWRWVVILPMLSGALGLSGCGGLDPVTTHEAETDPAALYMALTLNHRAINLAAAAPYETIQLVATPRDGRGEAMNGLPAPIFRLANSGDTTKLRVTPEGLVTALAQANEVPVVAELVLPGPVRHADTARVTVTPTPLTMLDSVSIEPSSAESALWPMGSDQLFLLSLAGVMPPVLTPQLLDAAGQPITGLVVEFASLDPARASVDRWTGQVRPRRPGPVQVVARTTAYGVTKADTARYTVGWQIEAAVGIVAGSDGIGVFDPAELWILPNAIVLFRDDLSDSVDVVFDDPTNVASPPAPLCEFFQLVGFAEVCGTGDMLVPGVSSDAAVFNGRTRSFPVPGIYTYHSTRTGATGRLVVTTEVPADMAGP